ncbi:hypothetical protein ACROYT_G017297 [Oculina patagonica]
MLITRSPSFFRDLQLFFGTQDLSETQTFIGTDLMLAVYKRVVAAAADQVREKEARDPVEFDVKSMPVEGLAKVRHVGAWAIRKVLDQKRKYAKEHVYSTNQATRGTAKKCFEICELLEDYIIDSRSHLQEISKYPETLSVTEEKQFRSQGLVNVGDNAYEFFLATEALRVKEMNESKLELHKEDTMDQSLKSLQSSAELKAKWMICFPPQVVDENKEVLDTMFELVIHRYVKMGAGQYLRDFRLAHRSAVTLRVETLYHSYHLVQIKVNSLPDDISCL